MNRTYNKHPLSETVLNVVEKYNTYLHNETHLLENLVEHEVRKYLEEKVEYLTQFSRDPRDTERVKEIIDLHQEPKWCEHMDNHTDCYVYFEDSNKRRYGYSGELIKHCLVCGKPKP